MNDEVEKASETIEADSNAVEVSVGVDGATEETRPRVQTGHRRPKLPTSSALHDSNTERSRTVSTAESNSGIKEALLGQGQSKDAAKSARIHLGVVAADYLEKLGRELLQTDAPRLLNEIKESSRGSPSVESTLTDAWVNTLMSLATRCCTTVEPDVKKGDLLDIRPYW